MKRILLILSLALAFVACKKEDSGEYLDKLLYAGADIKFTHNSEPIQSLYFNKEKGGTITIETNVDAFILGLGIYTEGVSDGKLFYTSSPPDFILKFEDIIKCKEYLYKCCKIIPDGFRKFNLTIEPNCDFDYIELSFCRIIESKEHGKIAAHGGTVLQVVPK